MGHQFENQPVVHNDQGHKKHQEEASLLLFHSANEDTIDVQHTRSPGHAAQQFNRDKHDQLDLLFLPLGTRDKHVFQSDEVSDTPICQTVERVPSRQPADVDSDRDKISTIKEGLSQPPQAAAEALKEIGPALPDRSRQANEVGPSDISNNDDRPVQRSAASMSTRQGELAIRAQNPAEETTRLTVPDDYFRAPAVVHAEKHHKETDNQGSLAVGFFNGFESTACDRQVRSAPGQYAEQTVSSRSTSLNMAWVVPAFSKDVSDVTWFKQSDVPIGSALDDNPRPYYRKH